MIGNSCLAFALFVTLPVAVRSAEFVTIDCLNGTQNQAVGINNHNWVVGTCLLDNITRSFYRTTNGVVHVFTVDTAQTYATDINDSNVIVGYYATQKTAYQGFLYASGVTADIDYPGATFTQPFAINAAGAVTGLFGDSAGFHGFVRDANGNFTSFDPPGSAYTVPRSINASGEVAGFFYNGSAATQGFVRDSLGNITVFTVPNALATTAFQINDAGAIVGWWEPANGSIYAQGYTRDPSGNFSTFGTHPQGNTYSLSMNGSGEVTGYGTDGASANTYFGFIQSGSTTPLDFSDPSAVNITEAAKINNGGGVVGWYSDGTISHGFARIP